MLVAYTHERDHVGDFRIYLDRKFACKIYEDIGVAMNAELDFKRYSQLIYTSSYVPCAAPTNNILFGRRRIRSPL